MVQKQQVADVQEMLPLNSEKKAASENSNTSSSDGHQYDLKTLDKIWAPSLLPKLTPKDQIDGDGTALHVPLCHLHHHSTCLHYTLSPFSNSGIMHLTSPHFFAISIFPLKLFI